MSNDFINVVAAASNEPEVVRGVLAELYKLGVVAEPVVDDADTGYRHLVLDPLNLGASHRSVRNIKLLDLLEASADLVPAAVTWNWVELIPGAVGFVITLFKASAVPLEPNDGKVIFAMWSPGEKTPSSHSIHQIAKTSKLSEGDVGASLLGLKAKGLAAQVGDTWCLADSVAVRF